MEVDMDMEQDILQPQPTVASAPTVQIPTAPGTHRLFVD
jgi:hypothetical protein